MVLLLRTNWFAAKPLENWHIAVLNTTKLILCIVGRKLTPTNELNSALIFISYLNTYSLYVYNRPRWR